MGITREDVELLRKAEENVVGFVMDDDNDAKVYSSLLLRILKNANDDAKVTMYVLRRLDTVVNDEPSLLPKRARQIASASAPPVEKDLLTDEAPSTSSLHAVQLDAEPFMALLAQSNSPVAVAAAHTLALLLAAPKVESADTEAFVRWILAELDSAGSSPSGITQARDYVPTLAILLRRIDVRHEVGQSGGVQLLCRLLQITSRDSSNSSSSGGAATATQSVPQLLYELCFCLWTLSFEEKLQPDFVTTGAIHTLTGMVQAAPREKVQRMCIAIFANLAQAESHHRSRFFREMHAAGLMKALESLKDLKAGKWKDSDIAEDLDLVLDALAHNYQEISTWERYAAEVKSGNLAWGACHEDQFWKENVRSIEEDDFSLLKHLCTLLTSNDEEIVSIACHDIGEFCRFYPRGRDIAKHFGAKDAIMGLIDSENHDVQRHALSAISKIMVNKWEGVHA
eukprot:scaffold876_cov243-Pinguiococcus_pyrenoidosus.AAC.54